MRMKSRMISKEIKNQKLLLDKLFLKFFFYFDFIKKKL